MRREGIAFVALTDRENILYVTDYQTLTWAYNARPLFVVIGQDDLLLVASRTDSRNIESCERGFVPAYYDGYLSEAVDTVLREISARDRTGRAATAIDYGQDMFGRGSLELIDGLRSRADGASLGSASDLIWRVRVVKSEYEAGLKRTAFQIVNSAFDAVIGEAHLGMTEFALYQRMQARIFMAGAERADPIAMAFGRGDFIYNRPPGPKALAAGDYIWTDFRSTYGGYPADRNRIARAGVPEPWECELYGKTREITVAVASGIRAGMTCGEVFASYERLWAGAGLGAPYGLLSRIGHGGGLGVTEPPSISRGNPEVIKAGMILHIEPKLERGGGVFQFEEIVYVTDSGIEFLSELAPAQIPVVDAHPV
ncbi:aminopeptidase P family protein [Pelagibius litoralis]|uniref:Aminopeptidase P family protein n=2 Tax=Pelagibius litoralis TaxID=374515 RepID=A0A967EVH7_9PROT|nr:aminopeptidase P family protein [Pelagibius litoralis]